MSSVSNIQSLCKKHNTTIPKLEKDLAFGKGSIYKWDKNSPSVDKLQKVADYFKVSTDYLLFGFDRKLLVQLINYIRNGRTYEQFSEDTGVNADETVKVCTGLITKSPSLETLEKIAANNPVDFIVDRSELFKAAGYLDVPDSDLDYRSFGTPYVDPTRAPVGDLDEANQLRDELHKRPELKILFDASKNASKEDLEKAVSYIEFLKKQSEGN